MRRHDPTGAERQARYRQRQRTALPVVSGAPQVPNDPERLSEWRAAVRLWVRWQLVEEMRRRVLTDSLPGE